MPKGPFFAGRLPEPLHKALRLAAVAKKKSQAAIVRKVLLSWLEEEARKGGFNELSEQIAALVERARREIEK